MSASDPAGLSALERLPPQGAVKKLRIMIVCTGNLCRSPMAEVMLRDRLRRAGVEHVIRSAGRLADGTAPPDPAAMVMRERGLNIAGRPSHPLDERTAVSADLILAMTREHVRDVAVLAADTWPKTFTLREIVRRSRIVGPRGTDESLAGWIARLHAGRSIASSLGADELDDIADPLGGTERRYRECAELIDELLAQFVNVAFASAPRPEHP